MNALAIERATLEAWPAARRETRFGWEYCATRGCSGRVNSVWPLAWNGGDVSAAIVDAQRWCAERGITPCFRLSDGLVAPAELPELLRRAGFAPQNETLVMTRLITAPLAKGRLGGDPVRNSGASRQPPSTPAAHAASPLQREEWGVQLVDTPDETIWGPMRAAAPNDADFAERQDIVSRITAPRVFARASLDGKPAAIGMGVLTGDLLGLYLMRTAPDARRRGLARTIVSALLDWGAARGAMSAYLQVEKSNAAAVALYETAGFAKAYSYWYWRLKD